MKLTEIEIEQIQEAADGNPAVGKLLLDYLESKDDPIKLFYRESTQMIKWLTGEMEITRMGAQANEEGQITVSRVLAGDTKEFERIHKLLVDAADIFAGLEKGRKLMDDEPEEDAKKKEKFKGKAVV
jgi:hypothetical protein